MIAAIPAPIVAILLLPVFRAFLLIFTVIGIGGNLAALPLALSGPLAGLAAAKLLIFNAGMGRQLPVAVFAAYFRLHGLALHQKNHETMLQLFE